MICGYCTLVLGDYFILSFLGISFAVLNDSGRELFSGFPGNKKARVILLD